MVSENSKRFVDKTIVEKRDRPGCGVADAGGDGELTGQIPLEIGICLSEIVKKPDELT